MYGLRNRVVKIERLENSRLEFVAKTQFLINLIFIFLDFFQMNVLELLVMFRIFVHNCEHF